MNLTLHINQANAHMRILFACAMLSDDPVQVQILIYAKEKIEERFNALQNEQKALDALRQQA